MATKVNNLYYELKIYAALSFGRFSVTPPPDSYFEGWILYIDNMPFIIIKLTLPTKSKLMI